MITEERSIALDRRWASTDKIAFLNELSSLTVARKIAGAALARLFCRGVRFGDIVLSDGQSLFLRNGTNVCRNEPLCRWIVFDSLFVHGVRSTSLFICGGGDEETGIDGEWITFASDILSILFFWQIFWASFVDAIFNSPSWKFNK